jgi:hypothetical protein
MPELKNKKSLKPLLLLNNWADCDETTRRILG